MMKEVESRKSKVESSDRATEPVRIGWADPGIEALDFRLLTFDWVGGGAV